MRWNFRTDPFRSRGRILTCASDRSFTSAYSPCGSKLPVPPPVSCLCWFELFGSRWVGDACASEGRRQQGSGAVILCLCKDITVRASGREKRGLVDSLREVNLWSTISAQGVYSENLTRLPDAPGDWMSCTDGAVEGPGEMVRWMRAWRGLERRKRGNLEGEGRKHKVKSWKIHHNTF